MTILELLKKLENHFPGYEWSLPPNLEFGILATNQAFIKAKEEKKNPVELAKEIAKSIQIFANKNKLNIKAVTQGPYINLDLTEVEWQHFGNKKQGLSITPSNKKVLLEYVSPNVAKPLHAGHIRNANLGEALRRILNLKYKNLITDNHWGDWGVQFGILVWAWKIFTEKKSLEVEINGEVTTVKLSDFEADPIDTLVKVYVWGNQQKEIVKNWEQIVRDEFIKLENNDPENKKLWELFLEKSKTAIEKDLELLNVVKFDLNQGESFYEKDMKLLEEFMETHNIWKKEEKARFVDLEDLNPEWKNFGRCYLISSNGYTTYAFRDVAARWQWARDHKAEKMITVTGNEQSHNFDQAFSIISHLAGLKSFEEFNTTLLNNQEEAKSTLDRLSRNNLIHIGYGFLTLPEGKMSTRKGNFLTARELIQEIEKHTKQVLLEKSDNVNTDNLDNKIQKAAIAALKWYDMAKDSSTNVTLDIPKILSFEGNTGIYQLYTFARLNSILRKNSTTKHTFNFEKLNSDEQQILKQTYTLPFVLEKVCENYKPHLLCNYLFDLATKVNSWYAKYPVATEPDQKRKETLLYFCEYLKDHLKFGLDLLAIDTVDSL